MLPFQRNKALKRRNKALKLRNKALKRRNKALKRRNKHHSNKRCRQHSKQLLHQANRLRAIGLLHANQAVHILLKTATIMASISFQAHTWVATILLKTKNALPTDTCLTAMVHGQMPSRTGCKTVGTKKRRLMNKTAESN